MNSDCWLSTCDACKDGKKLVPLKPLNTKTDLRQWKKVKIQKKVVNDENNEESSAEVKNL